MNQQELIRSLSIKTDTKIVMIVMDGLGGAIHPEKNLTELEASHHPNMDKLAKISACGVQDPVGPGITPGSGPGHLGLFGYDPIKYLIGRGLLDTVGIEVPLTPKDLTARGNFSTLDLGKGVLTDRRAGRIPTEENEQLCKKLSGIKINGTEIYVHPVKEHRVSVIFRGDNLSDSLTDADPQKEGVAPILTQAMEQKAEATAKIVNQFLEESRARLKQEKKANCLLLRGFSKMVNLPSFQEIYKLKSAAIAIYPMYRGLAQLVGMNVLKIKENNLEGEFKTLKENWNNFDFFFLHFKATDSAGEDGSFDKKNAAIEEMDKNIPALRELDPDVIVISGDHSTPTAFSAHSWHPVPTLIYSKRALARGPERFTEYSCLKEGILGKISSQEIMTLSMANAGKLLKYGA
ncbi:MAG: phosphoglycerate mutase [Elusimicrobia bacterium RIFCSPLOWO2_02_FULL_39_32]|nr:MAG: phosphoglycerate mutase [Elusimicrobia bacterium GWA2_38_7]OGR79827.1 MAG: phosphoglycerate mutase [Elusimicrobia bacterium RIFCSPHIGHO2_02_FULL_39_36]OGR93078.1 MAG: phosphoglycerate mutase [Elusimicrobia bacterium RIFCSPLOWO2_02_FULL_39_32]OGS00361.1 MAG: phosphoglycerate mutase [Elusimicrobia bacterium RIFCSPLOWO2_12_FULL_39_28]